ncbi:MAG: 6-hydroxymethylpterin diphosphokinase MptE-like protein [Conexivisphaera sp.]
MGPRPSSLSWLPSYAAIARALGLNPLADVVAAAALGIAAIPRTVGENRLRSIVEGRPAVVVGAGPSLERWAGLIAGGWPPFPRSLIAADDATTALLSRGVVPDVIVTDLDGDAGAIGRAARMGSVVVVLAHGDNIAGALRAASTLPGLVPTGQVVPLPNSRVYGGFTDGDRAVYLAAAMGATRAILVAMELEGEIGDYSRKNKGGDEWIRRKRMKLRIARALLDALAGSGFELVEPEAPDDGAGDQR